MPDLLRILETSLYVDDFGRACAFYERRSGSTASIAMRGSAPTLSAARVCCSCFCAAPRSRPCRCLGGTIPPHDGHGSEHVAFSIAADEFAAWEERLKDGDVEIEGRTKWPRGGESIYFRDPDGHLLEDRDARSLAGLLTTR